MNLKKAETLVDLKFEIMALYPKVNEEVFNKLRNINAKLQKMLNEELD